MTDITQAKILIVATDGFEQSELVYPRDHLRDAGAKVDVASLEREPIKGWDGSDWGDEVDVDLTLDEVDAGDYDALILPGGLFNPDKLRREEKAIGIVKDFVAAEKPVAAICHGPWLLIEAGAVANKNATSYPSVQTDLKNAGANWVDQEVVVDGGIITSRSPDDLEAFTAKIVELVERGTGAHDRAA